MISVKIADLSDSLYLNVYREVGEIIMGMDASTFERVKKEGD
jgi:hypothetical protein